VTYMQRSIEVGATAIIDPFEAVLPRSALLLVIEDGDQTTDALAQICDCLEIGVERVPSERDLLPMLHEYRPMAVVAQMDCAGQDGCHVMMTVAEYDRALPVMLLVGDDPALAGAADAVEEIWQLESVTKLLANPNVGTIVDFLFRAGRKGRCIRLMPV